MFDFNDFDFEKEIKKIKRIKGFQRAAGLASLANYLNQKQGDQAYQQLRKFLAAYKINLPKLEVLLGDGMKWSPTKFGPAVMLGAVKLFGWDKQDIIEMGKASVSFNFTIKLFVKYFSSLEQTFKKAVQLWKRYYNYGELELVEHDKQAKRLRIRLKQADRHKVVCFYYLGLFSQIVQMAVGDVQVKAKETKCPFEGDDFHEYLFEW